MDPIIKYKKKLNKTGTKTLYYKLSYKGNRLCRKERILVKDILKLNLQNVELMN